MIYLIKTDYYVETEENNKLSLLKIGYTKEDGMKTRFANYRLHNPLAKLLFEIPGLSELDETKLHHKFRGFKYQEYGREWFKFSQEILDFFTDLSRDPGLIDTIPLPPLQERKMDLDFKVLIRACVARVYSWSVPNPGDIDLGKQREMEKKILDAGPNNEADIWNLLRTEFGDSIITEILEFDPGDVCKEFIAKFMDLAHFTDRMKLLVDENLGEKELREVLDLLPLEYKKYYIALGSDRIKANGYQRSRLEKEYKLSLISSVGGGVLKDRIYFVFKEGGRYRVSDVKQSLQKIYNDLGLKSTPKATDLDKYFETKRVSVYNNGEQSRGIELIRKKSL